MSFSFLPLHVSNLTTLLGLEIHFAAPESHVLFTQLRDDSASTLSSHCSLGLIASRDDSFCVQTSKCSAKAARRRGMKPVTLRMELLQLSTSALNGEVTEMLRKISHNSALKFRLSVFFGGEGFKKKKGHPIQIYFRKRKI